MQEPIKIQYQPKYRNQPNGKNQGKFRNQPKNEETNPKLMQKWRKQPGTNAKMKKPTHQTNPNQKTQMTT